MCRCVGVKSWLKRKEGYEDSGVKAVGLGSDKRKSEKKKKRFECDDRLASYGGLLVTCPCPNPVTTSQTR